MGGHRGNGRDRVGAALLPVGWSFGRTERGADQGGPLEGADGVTVGGGGRATDRSGCDARTLFSGTAVWARHRVGVTSGAACLARRSGEGAPAMRFGAMGWPACPADFVSYS